MPIEQSGILKWEMYYVLSESRRTPKCNRFAVAVMDARSRVVGHVLFNLAPTVSNFLKRSVNKGTVEVTGQRVNRGAGYGVEIPCKYRLYGPEAYIDKLRKIINVDPVVE